MYLITSIMLVSITSPKGPHTIHSHTNTMVLFKVTNEPEHVCFFIQSKPTQTCG